MGFLKWGAGTAVSMSAVFIITFILVCVLQLPIMIPVAIVALIWACWPLIRYVVTGRYDAPNTSRM